jgi:site-specific recombinase XerD
MENQERSPETIKAYIDDLNMLFGYLKKKDTIEDIQKITLNDLENFVSYLKNKRNNSANSRIRRIDSIKSFYEFLCSKKNKLLTENIARDIDKPKVGKREMGFLTKEEAKQHLEANSHHYSSEAHTYAMTAWRAPKVERLLQILETMDWDAFEKG